jgi:hypothetical protein
MTAILIVGAILTSEAAVGLLLWIELAKQRYLRLYEREHGVRIPDFFSWEVLSSDRTFNPYWRMQAAALREPQDEPELETARTEVVRRQRVATVSGVAVVSGIVAVVAVARVL